MEINDPDDFGQKKICIFHTPTHKDEKYYILKHKIALEDKDTYNILVDKQNGAMAIIY